MKKSYHLAPWLLNPVSSLINFKSWTIRFCQYCLTPMHHLEIYGIFSIVTIIGDLCWHLLVQSTTNAKSPSMYETRAHTLRCKNSKRWPSANQKEVPHQRTKLVGTLVLDFLTSELMKKKFLLFKPPSIQYFVMEV